MKKAESRAIKLKFLNVGIITLLIMLLPVISIALDEGQDFCDFYTNADGTEWVPGETVATWNPQTGDCVSYTEVGELILYDGILGAFPRKNDNGVYHVPMVSNIITSTFAGSYLLIDPLLSSASNYIPFWDYDVPTTYQNDWSYYQSRVTWTHMTSDKLRVGVYGTYDDWYITNAYFTPVVTYLAYVPARDAYYKVGELNYIFASYYYTRSGALNEEEVKEIIIDELGGSA